MWPLNHRERRGSLNISKVQSVSGYNLITECSTQWSDWQWNSQPTESKSKFSPQGLPVGTPYMSHQLRVKQI